MNGNIFNNKSITGLKRKEDVVNLLKENGNQDEKITKKLLYEEELGLLQMELLKLQNWINQTGQRVVVVFEGRDAAGKGGAIKRFTRYLNPRSARVVALGKPSEIEQGQWYFRRHIKELPNKGEIVFFDRSWYNRAVVEPVMGFCSKEEYKRFVQQVPEFEHMLYESGVKIIKFWFSISNAEQARRFEERKLNPLKKWKLSPVDLKSRDLWDEYTHYIWEMFVKSHTNFSPWSIVKTDNKRVARLESIRHILTQFDYLDKEKAAISLLPDPNVVRRFNRTMFKQV